jgi:hypothetical protein
VVCLWNFWTLQKWWWGRLWPKWWTKPSKFRLWIWQWNWAWSWWFPAAKAQHKQWQLSEFGLSNYSIRWDFQQVSSWLPFKVTFVLILSVLCVQFMYLHLFEGIHSYCHAYPNGLNQLWMIHQ